MMKRFISLLLCTASIVPANAGQDDVMVASESHRLSVRSRLNSVSCGSSAVNLQREALEAYAVQKRKADAEAIQAQKIALDAFTAQKRRVDAEAINAQKVALDAYASRKEEQELRQAIQNSLAAQKEQELRNIVNKFAEEYELKQAIQNSLNTHKEEEELKQAIQNSLNTHKEEEELKQAIQNSYQTFQEEVDIQRAILESLKTEKPSKVQKVKLGATDLVQGKLHVNPQVQLLGTDLIQGKLNVNPQVQLLGTDLAQSKLNVNSQVHLPVTDLAQGKLIEDEDVLKSRLRAAQQELENLEAEIEFDQLIAEHGGDLTTDDEDVSSEVISPLGRDVTTDDLQALLDTLSPSQPYSPQPQTAFVKLGEAELAKGRFVVSASVVPVKSNAISYKSGKNKLQAELETLNAGSLFEEVTPEPAPAQIAAPARIVPVKSNAVSYKSGKNKLHAELEALNAGSAGSLFEQPAEKDLVAVGKVVQTAILLPLEEAPQFNGKEEEVPTVLAVSKMGYTPSPMAYENAIRFVAKPSTTERTEKKHIVIDKSALAVQMNNLRHVDAEMKTTYKPVEQKVFEDIKNIGKASLRSAQDRILPANPLKPKAKKVLSQEELIDRALHSIILKRDVSMRQGTNRAELSEDIAITMETLRELLSMSTEQVEHLIKEKRWEINNGKKALKQ